MDILVNDKRKCLIIIIDRLSRTWMAGEGPKRDAYNIGKWIDLAASFASFYLLPIAFDSRRNHTRGHL